MESYFYRFIDLANFAESFNGMHQGFRNPPIEGYWTPGFGGATGRGVIRNLRLQGGVEVPQGGGDGILITQGDRFGGYGFYVLKRANPYSPGIWQNFAQGATA
jgi:hypothetical protein